jgi:hypothetical protein
VFGRRKRDEQATEAAREAERKALFEELAKRPDTVCPFLGLAANRAGYLPQPNPDHRCYAFGDPAPLSDEQQLHVCLERGYSNCPRYLRGVLVIPSEELEALRRPQPRVATTPPPPPAERSRRGRRRWVLILPLLLLLIAAAGGGGWYLLNNPGVAILPSGSPTPTVSATSSSSPSATALITPSALATATPTPFITPTPLPTPTSGDVFLRYEVLVAPQPATYTLFRVDGAGNVTSEFGTSFLHYSHATVVPVNAPNGLRHWRVTNGAAAGWSYIAGRSGEFQIRKVYQAPDGTLHAVFISPDQS